jgi:hypothetical protein
MDCLVRLFHRGFFFIKEDMVFENMEDELEMFDIPPSSSELFCQQRKN